MDITDERFVELVKCAYSYADLMRSLQRNPNDHRFRKKIKEKIASLNVDTSHFGSVRNKSIWDDAERLQRVANESNGIGEFLQKLGLKNVGSNHETAKRHVERLQIDISHFEPTKRRDQLLREERGLRSIPIEEIIKQGKHPKYKSYFLKKRLFKEGIKEELCEECGQTNIWNEYPLNLQLDHIDGNRENHLLENLRVLCPNCHSQTETYAGKNKQ